MSVQILTPEDAIAIVERCDPAVPFITENFQRVFETTGCLLNCKDEKVLEEHLHSEKEKYDYKTRQQKKGVIAARKIELNQFRESRQVWFTASEITTSATQGCGSCAVLLAILIKTFFQSEQDLPNDYEYSIAQDFEMRYRRSGTVEPLVIAQLFQPSGTRLTYTA